MTKRRYTTSRIFGRLANELEQMVATGDRRSWVFTNKHQQFDKAAETYDGWVSLKPYEDRVRAAVEAYFDDPSGPGFGAL